MPGPRLPLEVLEGRGKKHLSKNEKAQRKAGDVKVKKASQVRAPVWLPEHLKDDFSKLGHDLLDSGLDVSKLDWDTVGRYLVAQRQFTAAMRKVNDALDAEDVENVAAWGREQERCFKQARACANDLGMTITSRCKLVVQQRAESAEDNDFLKLLEARNA